MLSPRGHAKFELKIQMNSMFLVTKIALLKRIMNWKRKKRLRRRSGRKGRQMKRRKMIRTV